MKLTWQAVAFIAHQAGTDQHELSFQRTFLARVWSPPTPQCRQCGFIQAASLKTAAWCEVVAGEPAVINPGSMVKGKWLLLPSGNAQPKTGFAYEQLLGSLVNMLH